MERIPFALPGCGCGVSRDATSPYGDRLQSPSIESVAAECCTAATCHTLVANVIAAKRATTGGHAQGVVTQSSDRTGTYILVLERLEGGALRQLRGQRARHAISNSALTLGARPSGGRCTAPRPARAHLAPMRLLRGCNAPCTALRGLAISTRVGDGKHLQLLEQRDA